jgi:hypothetical protein
MNVLLLQLDGSLPNIALMRLAAHHRGQGDIVNLQQARKPSQIQRGLFDAWDLVYASLIFERTKSLADEVLREFPQAIVGGTGWNDTTTLEGIGVTTTRQDYGDYPDYHHSIGYSQRGCTFNCSFCKVPRTEPGRPWSVNTISGIWRGDQHPRNICLLDNDFFGQKEWPERIEEIRAGKFKVCFNQGINVRTLNAEKSAAMASVYYANADFTRRRIYTAWDNLADESTLFRGLQHLVDAGVRPGEIMVYVLVGYDHATKSGRPVLVDDDFYRCQKLVEFGAAPYPMPFVRTKETVGFQRWFVRRDNFKVQWERWVNQGYRPLTLTRGSNVG